jgi:hypothetical protein
MSAGIVYKYLGSSFGCGAGSIIRVEIDITKCVVIPFFLFIVYICLLFFVFFCVGEQPTFG